MLGPKTSKFQFPVDFEQSEILIVIIVIMISVEDKHYTSDLTWNEKLFSNFHIFLQKWPIFSQVFDISTLMPNSQNSGSTPTNHGKNTRLYQLPNRKIFCGTFGATKYPYVPLLYNEWDKFVFQGFNKILHILNFHWGSTKTCAGMKAQS